MEDCPCGFWILGRRARSQQDFHCSDNWGMGTKGHWMEFLCIFAWGAESKILCTHNDEETELLLISFSVKTTAVAQSKEQNQK